MRAPATILIPLLVACGDGGSAPSVGEELHDRLVFETTGGSQRVVVPIGDLDRALDAEVSPDGRRVVFAGSRDDVLDLYVMNVDGSDLQQVTSDSAEDRHPTWTPEGTRLLFDRTDVDPRGRPVLTLMGADGSGRKQLRVDASVGVMRADGSETQLVLPSLAASGPVWSPDGARLAFTRTDGSPRVYVVTLATSDTVALSGGVVTDWVP